MAKKCGAYGVHVHRKDGTTKLYLPGEEYDAADAKLIDNPLAFEGGEDEHEPETVGHTAPPPQSGKGSGRDEWEAYANHYHVTIDSEMSRDDIIDACEAAGIAV